MNCSNAIKEDNAVNGVVLGRSDGLAAHDANLSQKTGVFYNGGVVQGSAPAHLEQQCVEDVAIEMRAPQAKQRAMPGTSDYELHCLEVTRPQTPEEPTSQGMEQSRAVDVQDDFVSAWKSKAFELLNVASPQPLPSEAVDSSTPGLRSAASPHSEEITIV